MRLLFLTTVLPINLKTGGEIASFQTLAALKKLGYTVKSLGYSRSGEEPMALDFVSVETRYIESVSDKLKSLIFLLISFLRHTPYSLQKYYSKKYIEAVANELTIAHYDFIIIDHLQMSWIIENMPDLPMVIITHNCEYDLYKKLSTQTPVYNFFFKWLYFREAKLMYKTERKAYNKATQVWTMNNTDLAKIKNDFGVNNIHALHIPGGFDNLIECKEKKYSVVILGTWTWGSNKKGLDWFLKNVLPYWTKE